MKKFFKLLSIILMIMTILFCGFQSDVTQAAETKEGVYGVQGYYIKSISKSGNKLKIATYKSKQLSTVRDDHLVFLSGKVHTFALDKNVKYLMQYYFSGEIKKSSLKKVQKSIKISKEYKDVYEYAYDTNYSDLESEDYPWIYFVVNGKGKVTDIQYREGAFDVLNYE